MTNHRGATRHDILPGGRYPGQDLYDVMTARAERAEAEVERLTVELTHRVGWEERCLDAEAALATLRAENARLRAAEAECRNSRGFVAAENERLRTALTEIAETCSVKKIDSQMTCKCAGGMARRALGSAKSRNV